MNEHEHERDAGDYWGSQNDASYEALLNARQRAEAPPAHFSPIPGGAPDGPWGPPPTGQTPQSLGGEGVATKGQRRARLGAGATVLVVFLAAVAGIGGGVLGNRLGDISAIPGLPEPAVSASPSPASASESASPIPSGPADVVAVATKVLPSSVTISVRTGQGQGTGSGFVMDDQGHVMTNNHVVDGARNSRSITLTFDDGSRHRAQVVGVSPSYDLAVLKVSEKAPLVPAEFANSEDVQIGQAAIAVGSPLGLGGTVTEGIVSAKDRSVVVGGSADDSDASAFINAVQTDAPINPGNSGGPLVDSLGRVIGVNSAILSLGRSDSGGSSGSIGVGFAIPITQANEIAQLLISDGEATYPTIGASVRTSEGPAGAEIASLTKSSAAKKAGLKVGDVLTSVDGTPVRTMVDAIVRIRVNRPGDRIKIGYIRDDDKAEADVVLDSKVG